MTITYKVLGQVAPGATTLTTLYTVPASTSTVCSTLVVCNMSAENVTFRVAVRPAGANTEDKHYLYYDVALLANDSFSATLGITLATTDVISVYGSTADLSFSLFGSEIS